MIVSLVVLLGAGGALIGFLLAVLGAGGSILLMPLLISGAALSVREAVPLSLLVVTLMALGNLASLNESVRSRILKDSNFIQVLWFFFFRLNLSCECGEFLGFSYVTTFIV